MKTFRYIGLALSAIMLCLNFSACSDDKDDSNSLEKIIVGVWTQDGDNDIFVVNADGTGFWYDNLLSYLKHEEENSDPFTWTCKDNKWLTIKYEREYEWEEEGEELVAKSISANKIVWFDDFNDYTDTWTWERYMPNN